MFFGEGELVKGGQSLAEMFEGKFRQSTGNGGLIGRIIRFETERFFQLCPIDCRPSDDVGDVGLARRRPSRTRARMPENGCDMPCLERGSGICLRNSANRERMVVFI